MTKTILTLILISAVIATQGQAGGQESRDVKIEDARRLSLEAEELIDRDEYDAALPKAMRALELREQALGREAPEVAYALGNVAYLYFKKNDYVKARELYVRAVAIQEKAGLENHEAARLLNNFGLLYYAEGDRATAEKFYRRALAIQEKLPKGLENPKAANIMTNLALVLFEKEDYEGAGQLYRHALAIQEERLGLESPNLIPTLNYFAMVHLQTGRRAEAIRLLTRAAGVLDKHPEYDAPDALLIVGNLLVLYVQDGNSAKAESFVPRALALLERNPEAHPDYKAVGYNALGQLYKARGDNLKAESSYRRAAEFLEKASLGATAYAAEVLTQLGTLYVEQGEYAKAKSPFERATTIRRATLGSEHTNYATSLANEANLYYKLRNYREAETNYKQALEIYLKTLGELHPYTATVINNLGLIYLMRGDLPEAEAQLQKALKIREQVLPARHEDIAVSLINLARSYTEDGNPDAAATTLQRVLTLYEQSRGTEDPLVAQTLNDLGLALIKKGEPGQAGTLLRRVLAINEKRFGKDHLNLTPILNNLALAKEARGEMGEATRLYEQALAIYAKSRVSSHPDLARLLGNFATLSARRGQVGRAISLAARAADIEEHYLNLMLAEGSESQNYIYWRTLHDSTSRIISIQTRLAPGNQLAARLGLTTVLRRKGRVLDATINSIQTLRANRVPANAELLDKLSSARSRLAAAILESPDEAAVDPAAVARLEEEYRKLEAQVSGAGAPARSQLVTIEDIQKLIPEGTALVELVAYKPFPVKPKVTKAQLSTYHYLAYVLRRRGGVTWVELGEGSDIHCELWDLRAALRNPAVSPEGKSAAQLAREVDEWVMRPVRRLLGTTRRLLISPDLLFQIIPFEALRDERGRYLLETYSFTYLSSARDLQRLRRPSPSGGPPIIIANPDFDKAARVAEPAPPVANSPSQQPAAARRATFPLLPGTEEEASQIEKLLPGARVVKRGEATVSALKQLHGPSILHIATHGFFAEPGGANLRVTQINGEEVFRPCIRLLLLEADLPRKSADYLNLLSQSGIALAGANTGAGPDGEDGILTALEVGGLDLRGTKLVVLSACETGIGDVDSGNGVHGLRRALAVAGAESQVISLWRVNDEATRDMMVKFYTGLRAGKGRGEAIREAKLAMLRSGNFSHPYFWAGFVQFGDWRDIRAGLN